MSTPKGPVLIELDEADAGPGVAEAPPVPDLVPATPDGQAMQMAARLAARPASRLVRWFWGLLASVIGAMVTMAAWDFATGLMERVPVLGWAVSGLMVALLAVLAALALRELAAFGRLSRIDELRRRADAAAADADLVAARDVTRRLVAFYKGREDTRWGRDRLAERQAEVMDAGALLELAEAEVLAPLDAAATHEVEAAARQVATVTALVPIALADVAAALVANLRMIRRIAEIYGGRSGTLGSLRLTRAVLSHLVATGAVAVGDDMLEPLLGGTVLARLSRRFGEGLVNGALTARVGVAAMDVCRPLAFSGERRPSARGIVRRALAGLFTQKTG